MIVDLHVLLVLFGDSLELELSAVFDLLGLEMFALGFEQVVAEAGRALLAFHLG